MTETRIYQMILADPNDRIRFDQFPVMIWWRIICMEVRDEF